MPKKYGKGFRDDPTFSKTLGDTSIDEKVTMKDVHKNINSMSGQFEKANQNYSEQLKRMSNNISSTAKQQQRLVEKIKMKELSSSSEIKAVEKSVQQILGKLGYVVETIGKNASRIMLDTARATKQHIAEYGRALSADFAINKTNFVAMTLAKTSPIFGYFVGKFMETTVFKHFSQLIKEKLGASVSYVGNKMKDLWGRGAAAVKEWWRDPKKWKKLGKAIENILKFPFKKVGEVLHYTWNGVKYIAKLPFKAIGAAFHLLVKSIGFIAKLPFKAIGALFKSAMWVLKLPFKMLGAIGTGWKDVSRKKQEKSRREYESRFGKPGEEMPALQTGGYVTKAGAAHIHAAEVVTPIPKMATAFKQALVPFGRDVVGELRGLRYAMVGITRDFSAAFGMALMRNKFIRGMVGTFSLLSSAYNVHKFFFKKTNKYKSMLSFNTNPQARISDNIALLFTQSMMKYDIMIAHLRTIEESITGKVSTAPKVEPWSRYTRFERLKSMWAALGGLSGIFKTGKATTKGLLTGAKGIGGETKDKLAEVITESHLKEKAKGALKTATFSAGLSFAAFKTRMKSAKGFKENVKALLSAGYIPVSAISGAAEGAGYDTGGSFGSKAKKFKEDFIAGAMTEYASIKTKRSAQLEKLKTGIGKIFEKSGLKSLYDKAKIKQEEKQKLKDSKNLKRIADATESSETHLGILGKAKKGLSTLWTMIGIGYTMIKGMVGKLLALPFKGVWELLKTIGNIKLFTAGGIFEKIKKIGVFLDKLVSGDLMFLIEFLPGMAKKAWDFFKTFKIDTIKKITSFAENISSFITRLKTIKFVDVIESLTKNLKSFGRIALRVIRFLDRWTKRFVVIGGIIATAKGLLDAFRMAKNAEEVHDLAPGQKASMSQRITAGIGGFFGGEKVGFEGAKTGALKGAGIGAMIGQAAIPIPIVGAAIGAVLGAVAGSILGAVGGKNIAKGLQMIWDELKSVVEGAWKVIKFPFVLIGELAKKAKDYIYDKYKSFTKLISEKLDGMLDPLFKFIDPVVNFVSDAITTLVGTVKGLISWIVSPFQNLKDLFDKIGQSQTEAVQNASKRVKEDIENRKGSIAYAEGYGKAWVRGEKQPEVAAMKAAQEATKPPEPISSKEKTAKAAEIPESKKPSMWQKVKGFFGGGKQPATAGGGTTEGKAFSGSQADFIKEMYSNLTSAAQQSNVPYPEIIARLGTAQSSLETGFGKHAPGNNYFGIKGGSGQGMSTKEYINGQWVTIQDKFRSYDTMADSAQGYVGFLQKNRRYQPVLAAPTIDQAISEQGRTGYATDPNYASKLSSINANIERTLSGGKTIQAAHEGTSYVIKGGLVRVSEGETIKEKAPGLSMSKSDILNSQQSGSPQVAELAKSFGAIGDNISKSAAAIVDASSKIVSVNVSSNNSQNYGNSQGNNQGADKLLEQLLTCNV